MPKTRSTGTKVARPSVRTSRSTIVPDHWLHAHARRPLYCGLMGDQPCVLVTLSMTLSISRKSSTFIGRPEASSSFMIGPWDADLYLLELSWSLTLLAAIELNSVYDGGPAGCGHFSDTGGNVTSSACVGSTHKAEPRSSLSFSMPNPRNPRPVASQGRLAPTVA